MIGCLVWWSVVGEFEDKDHTTLSYEKLYLSKIRGKA